MVKFNYVYRYYRKINRIYGCITTNKVGKVKLDGCLVGNIMIDEEGYRSNVGIILSNPEGRLLWARRIGQDAWQFPQGGIEKNESPEDAMYRELWEEVGLVANKVDLLGSTQGWLRYNLPKWLMRNHEKPLCVGQKQVWFLLRLVCNEEDVKLDLADKPEFDGWRWVDYWHPLSEVVEFKREVYKQALSELAPFLNDVGIKKIRY